MNQTDTSSGHDPLPHHGNVVQKLRGELLQLACGCADDIFARQAHGLTRPADRLAVYDQVIGELMRPAEAYLAQIERLLAQQPISSRQNGGHDD